MLIAKVFRAFIRCAMAGAVFSAISLWACSVPVFRYAIEHWAADPYQAVIFHRGPLTEAQQALVKHFGRDGKAGELHSNISVRTIDLDQQPTPEELQFWRQLDAPSAPWLVVRYPPSVRLPNNIWSGPLDDGSVQTVLDSAARREVVRRLGQGQSAVWVLLESGDRSKDQAATELVEARLAYLMTVLELPKLEAQDIANGLVSVGQEDLRLEFSLLRVSRQDQAEQVFVKMLLGTEADLEELKEPMVFPIFGRGRALYALIGKGINHETIDEAASFLIGKCSCQVKEQNPGVDLLMSADWKGFLKSQSAPIGDLPAVTALPEAAPTTVTISASTDSNASSMAQPAAPSRRVLGIPILAIAAAAGLLAVGLFWFSKK